MAVHPEPLTGLHTVVVDDPQGAKTQVGGVVIVAKRKRVVGVEPAVVEVASLASRAYPDHACLLSSTCILFTYQVYGQKNAVSHPFRPVVPEPSPASG